MWALSAEILSAGFSLESSTPSNIMNSCEARAEGPQQTVKHREREKAPQAEEMQSLKLLSHKLLYLQLSITSILGRNLQI